MAHTFDVKNRVTASINPVAASLTPTSGATVLVAVILVAGTTDRTGGSPTWNGTAMTKAGATIKATEGSVEIWYILNPAIGTFNCSVPNANTRQLDLCVSSYKAAAGNTTVFDTTGSTVNTAGSTNPSSSITPASAGALVVAGIANGATTWNPTGRTGVQLNDADNGSWGGGSQYILSATTPQTVAWTFGTSDDWAILAASFLEQAGATDRQGYVTFAEFETPNAPRLGRVTWAELETPNAPRLGRILWAEAEVPTAPRVGRVLWSEFEVPTAPRLGRVLWAELEAPDAPTLDRVGQILWAEAEVPNAPRIGRILWAEAEVPTAPRLGQITWAEFEVPFAPRLGRILWVEFEVPSVGGNPPQSHRKQCAQCLSHALHIEFQ